nr:GNAT family N-acetyltransferase [Bacillus canaveralius]
MEIRKMTEQDLTYSLKLSMYAFQYELPDSDIPARIDKIKHHDVFGIWDGTQLTAKLNIIPFKVIIQNRSGAWVELQAWRPIRNIGEEAM